MGTYPMFIIRTVLAVPNRIYTPQARLEEPVHHAQDFAREQSIVFTTSAGPIIFVRGPASNLTDCFILLCHLHSYLKVITIFIT